MPHGARGCAGIVRVRHSTRTSDSLEAGASQKRLIILDEELIELHPAIEMDCQGAAEPPRVGPFLRRSEQL